MDAHYLITHNTLDQGAGCRLLYLYWASNSVHFKDLGERGGYITGA